MEGFVTQGSNEVTAPDAASRPRVSPDYRYRMAVLAASTPRRRRGHMNVFPHSEYLSLQALGLPVPENRPLIPAE